MFLLLFIVVRSEMTGLMLTFILFTLETVCLNSLLYEWKDDVIEWSLLISRSESVALMSLLL